jgi:hypothetical protein
VRRDVHPAVAGPAGQVLHRAADVEVDAEVDDVDGHGAGGLVAVDHDESAYGVGLLDQRPHVDERRGAEQHVRALDEGGALVDGVDHALDVEVMPSSSPARRRPHRRGGRSATRC